MTKFAAAVLAAIVFALPKLAVAGNTPIKPATKPSSFVPHAHTNHHVYGSPVHSAIVGHAKKSHRGHAPKQRPSSARQHRSHWRRPENASFWYFHAEGDNRLYLWPSLM